MPSRHDLAFVINNIIMKVSLFRPRCACENVKVAAHMETAFAKAPKIEGVTIDCRRSFMLYYLGV
jgi:hypothetical protein